MEQQYVKDVMSKQLVRLAKDQPARAAAEQMKSEGIGSVIVEDDGRLFGLVTDRDLTVRVMAEGKDANKVSVGEVCSKELASLSPEDSVDNAVKLMAKKGIRRIPVADDSGRAVGIVSLGDLAMERDPGSALGSISSQRSNI